MHGSKKKYLLLPALLLAFCLTAQVKDPELHLLQQLDSVSRSTSPARYFAALYLVTTANATLFFRNAPPAEQAFISKLEQTFADYFFSAAANRGHGTDHQAWFTYFSRIDLKPLQYQLLGINAHINEDLGRTLYTSFSLEELTRHRKSFSRFQNGLKKQFLAFYQENKSKSLITGFIDKASLGLASAWGIRMLRHWRNRQFRLALLHYTNPEKARKLRLKITRKKEWTDRQVLRLF